MTMDKTKITKFIIVSACKDTTNKVCKMAKCNIQMYFINLVSVMNDIYNINIFENEQDAHDYLMCLTNKKQKRICVNDNVYLGVIVSEFDQIIQKCLIIFWRYKNQTVIEDKIFKFMGPFVGNITKKILSGKSREKKKETKI